MRIILKVVTFLNDYCNGCISTGNTNPLPHPRLNISHFTPNINKCLERQVITILRDLKISQPHHSCLHERSDEHV